MKKNKQKGFTFISLVIMVVIALFIVTTTIKIAPVYIENYSVKSSLTSIASEINDNKIKPKDIKPKLINRLKNNNVTHINEEQIVISGGTDHSTLSITYEIRKPVLGNIDFMMTFNNAEAITL